MEEVKTTVEKELDKQTEKFNESIYKLNTPSLKSVLSILVSLGITLLNPLGILSSYFSIFIF